MSAAMRAARSLVEHRLVRNTGWSMVGEMGRLFTQITVFVILTYLFAPDEYGALIGTLGLLMFLQPYAQLGATHLLLQRVAGDGWDVDRATRHGMSTAVVGGMVSAVLLVALQPFVLPQVDVATLALLSLSELVGAAMIEVVIFVGVATERLRSIALLRTTHGVLRSLAAITLVVVVDDAELWMWALAALSAAVITALVGQLTMAGGLVAPVVPTAADIRQGVPLSVGFGAQKIRASADMFLLVRLDQTVDAGIYGAASRVIGIARIPMSAMLFATNARLYTTGARSVREGRDLAARLTVAAVGMGSAIALALFVTADVVVALLPDDYADTGPALRWLAVLPILASCSSFAGTMLTAARLHRYRVALLITSALLNIGLNILWIPDHGWRGAAVASFISAGLYAVGVWVILQHFARAEGARHGE